MVGLVVMLQVYLWRILLRVNTFLNIYLSSSPPPSAAFTIKIQATTGRKHAKIPLQFYTPKNYHRKGQNEKYPLVVNFHGGGCMMGDPYEDARWLESVTQRGAVAVSVGYRLVPENPHPTGIDDCVDAIRWLWDHADSFALDKNRTVLCGFSFGGTMTFVASMRLGRDQSSGDGRLCGLISVYPGLDRTLSREERARSNPKGRGIKSLNQLFDKAYQLDLLDKTNPEVSPAKASDKMLQTLPDRIALYGAELDFLLPETEAFRKRLTDLGKSVSGETIIGRPHYWDKKPSYRKADHQRDLWHAQASDVAREMWSI